MLPAASTSNPPLFLTPFGLPPCLPPLQSPIRRSRESLLDFLRAFRRFNVQSAALANPFWTSSVSPAASTSNPPLLRIPFGLPPCLPPLQRPIHRSCESLLDFLRVSRCFNVQSTAPVNPFWTSSVLPTASTSNPHNPPRFHAFVFITFEYFINYYLTLILEYFIFLL